MAKAVKTEEKVVSAREFKRRGPLRLLVIRHAVAEDASVFAATGQPDAERPLTPGGRKKFRRAAKGIIRLVPDLGLLACSPLVRAVETAEILSQQYARVGDETEPVRLSALAPGKSPNLLLGWLSQQKVSGTIVVVGHEPHLGHFVSWTLTGLRESFMEFKKGAACLLEFDEEVRAGRGKLLWSLRPGQLRALADCE